MPNFQYLDFPNVHYPPQEWCISFHQAVRITCAFVYTYRNAYLKFNVVFGKYVQALEAVLVTFDDPSGSGVIIVIS